MLLTEPIVYCFALYDGLNYGIIVSCASSSFRIPMPDKFSSSLKYLAVEAIPLVYAQYGLKDPSIALTFFALQIGFALAIPLFYFQLKAVRRREEKESKRGVPEHKLLWAFFGTSTRFIPRHCCSFNPIRPSAAILFPVSMFWFAWTSYPPINMCVSLGALVAFGISGHISALSSFKFVLELDLGPPPQYLWPSRTLRLRVMV